MTRARRKTAGLLWVLAALVAHAGMAELDLDALLGRPALSDVVAADEAPRIAWIEEIRGVRNLWTAVAPDFEPRRLTAYEGDDGRPLGALRLTADGSVLVWVRGSAPNAAGEIANPNSDPGGAVDQKIRWYHQGATGLEGSDGPALGDEPEDNAFFYHLGGYFIEVAARDYAAAKEHAHQMNDPNPVTQAIRMWMMGSADLMAHGVERGRGDIEASIAQFEAIVEAAPGNAFVRSFLAEAYAWLGQEGAAVREARLAVDLSAKDKFAGPLGLETLARVYVRVGRHEEAIDLLEELMKTIYQDAVTVHILTQDPGWDPLRKNPRFQKLIAPQS